MTVFLYAFRERELILDLFEEFCGARLTYNSMRIGGLPQDIPPGWDKKVLEFCKIMDCEGRRVRDAADAQPHLAGADQGHRRDWRAGSRRPRTVRAAAARIGRRRATCGRTSLTPPTTRWRSTCRSEPSGDTYDRYLVRMEEFRQSLRIIRQATEGIPEGPIVGKVPRLIKPPAGETYHAIESPKGELGYFIVSDGKSTNPYRFRVRPPSFCNLQGLRRLVQGPSGGRRRRADRVARHRAWGGRSVMVPGSSFLVPGPP